MNREREKEKEREGERRKREGACWLAAIGQGLADRAGPLALARGGRLGFGGRGEEAKVVNVGDDFGGEVGGG